MGFFDFFQSIGSGFNMILDPILKPLLKLGPFWAVLIVSFLIAVIMTLMYWWFTDQKRMKEIKEETKKFQTEIKRLSKENPKKAMEMQAKMFGLTKEQMMSSLKPTFITIIPLLLIFGWLNTHMGYDPIMKGEEFQTTLEFYDNVYGNVTIDAPSLEIIGDKTKEIANNQVNWKLKAEDPGDYSIDYEFSQKTYTQEISVKDSKIDGFKPPIKLVKDGLVKQIRADLKKIIVIPLFGLNLGWLWSYILFSLIFSMGMRKIFKIY